MYRSGTHPRRRGVLDLVHKGKIEASHAILVLNVFGYIGKSTLSEIDYAERLENPSHEPHRVYMLESWGKDLGVGPAHYPHVQKAAERYGVPQNASPIDTFNYPDVWRTELLGEGGTRRWSILRRLKARTAEALGYK